MWPSGLLLSEFILSRPDIFTNKSCFEVTSLLFVLICDEDGKGSLCDLFFELVRLALVLD